MIHVEVIPRIGAAKAWRDAARRLLSAGVAPDRIRWDEEGASRGLFDDAAVVAGAGPILVPRAFASLADSVVWHSDADRFARLYALLFRLRAEPHLMSDRGDADLAHLRRLEKNVHRCQHKMKAFVRFREIGDSTAPRRSFAAWFEPTHHTVEPTADFFVRRFSDMDWRIVTPGVSAVFEAGRLQLVENLVRPDLPDDAAEDLWVTYFRNIFNPARVKMAAMKSEMPVKYWKNMPETAAIPQMLAAAPARLQAMIAAAPTLPPSRTARVQALLDSNTSAWDGPADAFHAALQTCTRCPLHKTATQAVPGEGPMDARLMIVGEQPGDQEDLQGRPFVGPAGQLFDQAAAVVGLDRRACYVTNAVKHFKFTAQGRRRIHQRPEISEVNHCRWWLEAEVNRVRPALILGMGATAAFALTGSGKDLALRRGTVEQARGEVPVLLTFHPAYILRLPAPAREQAMAALQADLALALNLLGQGPAHPQNVAAPR